MFEVGGKLIYGPTKSYRGRTIALPRSLRDMLNTHLTEEVAPGPDDLVFTMTGPTYKTPTYRPGTPLATPTSQRRCVETGSSCGRFLLEPEPHLCRKRELSLADLPRDSTTSREKAGYKHLNYCVFQDLRRSKLVDSAGFQPATDGF